MAGSPVRRPGGLAAGDRCERLRWQTKKVGWGKTTTAVCIAGALAERGEEVLVVDADAQGNATRWLDADSLGPELLEAWEGGEVGGLIVPTTIDDVDLLPSSPMLAVAEKRFAAVLGSQLLLRDALRALPKRWSWMLIDCPPTLGFVTTSATSRLPSPRFASAA
jgi:chromosome partitioning protein